MCEQLKREMDICRLQEVRWRGQETRFVGCRGRRDKLWWSENNDGIEGVEISVKKLCENVIKVQRKSGRVMAMVLVLRYRSHMCICSTGWKVRV